jgi:hypothetical protein
MEVSDHGVRFPSTKELYDVIVNTTTEEAGGTTSA